MMTDFTEECSVAIQAPIEAVYEYVSDFPRHVEWNHQPTEMTKLTDGPVGVGSVFRTKEQPTSSTSWLLKPLVPLVTVLFGGTGYTEAEITTLEPNRRVAWKAAAPKKKGGFFARSEWELRLESRDEATLITQWVHLEFLGKMGERMNPETAAVRTGEEMEHNLAILKEIMEAQTASGKAPNRPAFA